MVKPIAQVAQRGSQEAGKIKIGIYAKGRPQSIETFRFTSHDQVAIARIAELYGGVPARNGDGLWDVTTKANEIDVVLPPNCLGDTPIYMLWSGGGMARKCDGESCTAYRDDGNDLIEEVGPCICDRKQKMECSPETRLAVLLPNVRLGGVWNLRTKSAAAAAEFTQMVELIAAAQARGLTKAKLGIEARTARGKRRKFKVPVLRLDNTIEELMAGEGALRAPALEGPAPQLALSSAPMIDEVDRKKLNAGMRELDRGDREAIMNWIDSMEWDIHQLTVEQGRQILERIEDHTAVEAELVPDSHEL